MKKLRTFKVYVKSWLRGKEASFGSALYRSPVNKFCCLGFMCEQLYHKTPENMEDESYPDCIGIRPGRSGTFADIGDINDDSDILDSVRKKRLAPLFKKLGLKPVYVNRKRPETK